MSPEKLNQMLAKASKSVQRLNADLARIIPYPNETLHHSPPQTPEPQSPVQPQSPGPVQRTKGNPGCVRIRVTGYRVRLLDSDDPCPKYFVDCLRYSGLIHSDAHGKAEVTTTQRKVAHYNEERTVIEIEYP